MLLKLLVALRRDSPILVDFLDQVESVHGLSRNSFGSDITRWKRPKLFDEPPKPKFLPGIRLLSVFRNGESSDNLLIWTMEAEPFFEPT